MDPDSNPVGHPAPSRARPTRVEIAAWCVWGFVIAALWGLFQILDTAWEIAPLTRATIQVLAIGFIIAVFGYYALVQPLRTEHSPLLAGIATSTISFGAILVHFAIFERWLGMGSSHDPQPLAASILITFFLTIGLGTALATLARVMQHGWRQRKPRRRVS